MNKLKVIVRDGLSYDTFTADNLDCRGVICFQDKCPALFNDGTSDCFMGDFKKLAGVKRAEIILKICEEAEFILEDE